MPRTGAKMTDSKSITDDICRRSGSDKSEPCKPACLSAERLLVDRLVRTIDSPKDEGGDTLMIKSFPTLVQDKMAERLARSKADSRSFLQVKPV